MKIPGINSRLIIGILIAIFFGVSLYLRVSLPYDKVFSGDWIKFTSIDAYYHMRLVDNLVHNLPNLTRFDPFSIYPGGYIISGVHFFDWFLASVIWVIGLGSPTQHTINVVGVYFPAILAAIIVIPVYFLGKVLFNRWAGVLAAALIAVLPGEFLGRSILGFTDHHVAETLFSSVAILFLILAIKEAGQRQLTFSHLRHRDWKVIARPLVYSLLAGFFLGIYLITWLGGLLFVFIIALYFVIQFIINHLRHRATDHLCIIGFILFLVALIIFLPFSPTRDFSAPMVVAVLIPLALAGTSRLISARGLKPAYYPLTLIGMGIVFMAIFYAVAPHILAKILEKFSIFAPVGATATTTLEMQPFLSPQGSFSTLVAWGNFTTSFFLIKNWPIPGFALIAFIILIYLFIKKRGDKQHQLLFLLWTLVVLVVTLVQRRFAYYFVVNVALLSAYLSWQAIWLVGLRTLAAKPEPIPESVRPERARVMAKRRRQASQGFTIYHVNVALAIIVVFLLVFFWNISKAREVASQARYAPSDAWQESLLWMKENTPEPLGDPDAYNRLYEPGYNYPESAYGVTAWWDYGYWITRTAHRIPSANPSQSPEPIKKVAGLFLSQDESLSQEIMEELGSSYIIGEYDTCTSKFWAVVTWAGQEQDKFIGVYYVPHEGKLVPVQLFHPEYYRSTLVRLYNFDGKAVTNESPMVVSYDVKVDRDGNHYRQITSAEEFPSYQEALDYVESQKTGNYVIAGANPFVSPITLEEMQDYKLVYSSQSEVSHPQVGMIPEVKVFEYTR